MTKFSERPVGTAHGVEWASNEASAWDAILRVGRSGVISTCNRAASQLYGYPVDGLVGKRAEVLVPPAHRAQEGEILRRVFAGENVADYRTQRLCRDGTILTVSLTTSAVLDPNGAVIEMTSAAREVEEPERTDDLTHSTTQEPGRFSEQLTHFFDLSTDLLCIAGSDGFFKWVNPAWERILGWTEAELIGRPFLEFIHPDDAARTAAESAAQQTVGKVSMAFDNRYRCRDGSYRWLSWNAIPHGDFVHAVARDTTQQRQASEDQARLAAIVDSTDDAIIAKTLDGTITSWNRGAERIYGYRAEEAIGRSIEIIFNSETDGHWILERIAAGESITDYESVRRRRDGTTVHIGLTISPIRDSNGRVMGAASIGRDITGSHQAEERFRRLVESAPDAMIIADADGNIMLANEQVERLFGYQAAELIGQPFELLVPHRVHDLPLTHRDVYMRSPAILGMGAGEKLSGHRRDGTEFPIEISLAPLDTEQGALVSASIRDASERQKIERALNAARDAATEAATAKSAFLATMSHEIRTPMNAVIGLTGLLLDTDLTFQQREFLTIVRDSGDALLFLINDILDFSKIEAGQLELEDDPFDVRDCIDTALSLVAVPAAAKRLELVGLLEAGCPPVLRGDVTRLRQVLVNLLSNAVKFTPAGEVVVSGRADPVEDGGDGAVRLQLTVRDTGIGVPADRMDRLFQSFSQVDASTTRVFGGTGLGLAISRRLAQAMGGDLTVSSQVGVGSVFTVTALLHTCSEQVSRVQAPDAALEGRTALIVDDNATNRTVLRGQLTNWGLRCVDVASAAEALELFSGGTRFDVAVLDMNMPDTDGAELASALRRLPSGHDLPLVLLSSVMWRSDADQRRLFDAALTKPARASALRATLTRVLASPKEQPHPPPGDSTDSVPAAAPLRILLAEDNQINQKVAQLMLAKLGHRIDTVANGQEAVQALQRASYDVVLMDVQMPVLDGLDATRLIRAELPADRQPYIVAMTASALLEDRAACRAAGMDDYLAKPVRAHDLTAALHIRPT